MCLGSFVGIQTNGVKLHCLMKTGDYNGWNTSMVIYLVKVNLLINFEKMRDKTCKIFQATNKNRAYRYNKKMINSIFFKVLVCCKITSTCLRKNTTFRFKIFCHMPNSRLSTQPKLIMS